MKKRLTVAGIILILLLVVWWLWPHPSGPAPEPQTTVEPAATSANVKPVAAGAPTKPSTIISGEMPPTNREQFAAWQAQIEQRREQAIEQGRDEWRTPIEFYGKVVDENGQPVPDAQIDFACNDLSAEGTSSYRATSDGQGLFSITGIQGKLLTAKVTKAGYYTSKRDNASFYYAGQNENFIPDRSQPVLFHLRKKGERENLNTASGRLKIPLDGTPRGFDFETGKPVSAERASVIVECQSDYQNKDAQGRFDWVLRIRAIGGGAMESTNEFDFEAPVDGYSPAYEIRMKKDMEQGWATTVDRRCFVKLPNGRYAKLAFSFIAYNGVFRFRSFENPSGGRSLECDPDFQPAQTAFE